MCTFWPTHVSAPGLDQSTWIVLKPWCVSDKKKEEERKEEEEGKKSNYYLKRIKLIIITPHYYKHTY